MEHTLQRHNDKLRHLCRLCGKRCLNKKQREANKTPRDISSFQKDVLIICHTNINEDINDFHSPSICHKCVCSINRIKSGNDITLRTFLETFKKTDSIWTLFDSTKTEKDCVSCATYDSFAKGNRYVKKDEEVENSQGNVEEESIRCDNFQPVSSSYFPTSYIHDEGEPTMNTEELEMNVGRGEEDSMMCDLSQPVSSSMFPISLDHDETESTIDTGESTNSNTDMLMRLARALERGDSSAFELTADDSIEAEQTNISSLSSTPYNNLQQESGVTSNSPLITSVPSPQTPLAKSTPVKQQTLTVTPKSPFKTPPPKKKTYVDSVTSPIGTDSFIILPKTTNKDLLNKPLSKEEELLASHLIERKLNTSERKDVIRIKTRGQPRMFHRYTVPRKLSSTSTSPLRAKRALAVDSFREHIAGGSGEIVKRQKVSEIKRMKRKSSVLADAGIEGKDISPRKALAMKETMNLSYHQYNIQGGFLRAAGTKIPSEHAIRKIQKRMTAGDTEVKMLEYENNSKEKEMHWVETAFVKDLPNYVIKVLDSLHQNNQIMWHDGAIPDEEIWLKVGGDHGKGSFKVSLHVCNVDKPNSKRNTHLIAMAKVPDTTYNIQVMIGEKKEEFDQLCQMEWKGKKVRLFVFGDYWFLCKLYGLSGPSGTFPCLWCHASKQQIQYGPSAVARNLASLQTDFESFQQQGEDKAKAKLVHNVIRPPMLAVEIDRVCPPYLHILLGLVTKHHRLLETESRSFDEAISEERARVSGVTHVYEKYGQNWPEARPYKEEKRFLKTCIIFSEIATSKSEVREYKRQLMKVEKKLDELKLNKNLKKGPVCRSLQIVLDKHKIVKQAFHGGHFIGNHCHKYLVDSVFRELTRTAIDTVGANTQQDNLISKVFQMEGKFNALNEAFKRVHEALSFAKPASEKQIDDAQTAIINYMAKYRCTFAYKITPKHHILENHCVPWMRLYKFGMGFHGEQGGEMLHSTVAHLERRAQGIRQEKSKMRFTIESSLLHTVPELANKTPSTRGSKN